MFREVWIFADWKKLGDVEKETLLSLNVSDVVLGIIGFKGKQTVSTENIIDNVKWLQENNIQSHLMVWMHKSKNYITKINKKIDSIINVLLENDLYIRSVLFDCEKSWHKGSIKSKEATDIIYDNLVLNNKFVNKYNIISFGITGLAILRPSLIELLQYCDYCIPQSYSFWSNEKDHWSHSIYTEPDFIVNKAHETWSKHTPKHKIIPGIGIFNEERPVRNINGKQYKKYNIAKTLNTTIDTIKSLEYDRCAFYSLKHARSYINDNIMSQNGIMRSGIIKSLIKKSNNKKLNIVTQYIMKKHLELDIGNFGIKKNGVDGIWGFYSQKALNNLRLIYDIKYHGNISEKELVEIYYQYIYSTFGIKL